MSKKQKEPTDEVLDQIEKQNTGTGWVRGELDLEVLYTEEIHDTDWFVNDDDKFHGE